LDDHGLPIEVKGQVGSIIGTSLNSFITPFIRYKSGDLATYGSMQCSSCGRQFILLEKIEGRTQNVLILNDGRKVPMFPVPFNIEFEAFKRIKKTQMIQNVKGQLIFKLSVTDDFSFNDELEIKTKMISSVNNQLSISFIYTDNDFIRSESGKHIYFIQNIPN